MASDFIPYDPTLKSLDPVLTGKTQAPSPQEELQAELVRNQGVGQRISSAEASGPTIRQRTQSEIIDLTLIAERLGNPFSIRWIPFEQLRDMTTDLMLAFGWWMTMAPILRADFMIQCPDAQLAAAVDEALREVDTNFLLSFSNALWYGHQPLVKQFKLGRLGNTYRDPNGSNPELDLPVWPGTAQALLWKPPAVLNPSHCLPTWNDDGEMIGYKFSNTPIPHFDLISAASAYGYMVIPGHEISSDYAMWIVNEQELNFGSVFGSSRTKRAYPYWWSYWFRWRLADRSFENLADPAKYVYYPVDFDEYLDPDDPDQESPKVRQARQTALDVGAQMRSGSTTAFPGSFAEGSDGKSLAMRKWEAGYYNTPNNFTALDSTFKALDIMKLRAWFTPEQSVIEGSGSRTAGGSSGGTGGARMASQLADVQAESQQGLVSQYDAYINDHMIPQFIAANFPEKIGTPCKKVSGGLGAVDDQTFSQVLTLIGQVQGEVLPVDIRSILKQRGIPLLNQKQMELEISEIAKLKQIMGPPQMAPTPNGTQGYNAGVEQNEQGKNQYMQPPNRIVLAESDSFMNSLPDTPHFRDAGVRSSLVRLRRLYLERYESQYKSFADFLEAQPTLHLAENGKKQKGLSKQQAAASATAILAAWAATYAPGAVGAADQVASTGFGEKTSALTSKIALAGGHGALKETRLDAADFGAPALNSWINDRTTSALDSVDSTVRTELKDWLVTQLQDGVDPATVAAAAREHFSGFPASHADRAARTESTEAFNRGTLEALDRAGVAQVQLHDASDGKDTKTDAPCLARNGKVMSIAEAKKERLAHPNCTLYMTAMSTDNLSIKRVDELPSRLAREGANFAYDSATEVFYVTELVSSQQEQALMLILGQQLSLQ